MTTYLSSKSIVFTSSRILGLTTLAAAGLLCSPVAQGTVIYDESVSGDLSNSGLSPTLVAMAAGSNQILGTTGRGSEGVDRDYFTFTIPAGLELTSITVLPGTTVAGAVSFIGIEGGTQVTLPTNPMDATGLLGWLHYSAADINSDILGLMGAAADGSSGFVPPLTSGSYAVWVQEFSTGVSPYGFDFTLGATPAKAPDSGPGLLLCLSAFGVLLASHGLRSRY